MNYEYVQIAQLGLGPDEFVEILNDYGEEGFRLVDQNTFGIFLLEREIPPEEPNLVMTTSGNGFELIPYAALVILAAIVFLFVLMMILGWGFHWIR